MHLLCNYSYINCVFGAKNSFFLVLKKISVLKNSVGKKMRFIYVHQNCKCEKAEIDVMVMFIFLWLTAKTIFGSKNL